MNDLQKGKTKEMSFVAGMKINNYLNLPQMIDVSLFYLREIGKNL